MISSRDTLTRGMRLVRVENPEEVLQEGLIPGRLHPQPPVGGKASGYQAGPPVPADRDVQPAEAGGANHGTGRASVARGEREPGAEGDGTGAEQWGNLEAPPRTREAGSGGEPHINERDREVHRDAKSRGRLLDSEKISNTGVLRDRARLLPVGGGGGLVGRHVLPEFAPTWSIRSLHRHPVAGEAASGVEWVTGDAACVEDWKPLLKDVDLVLNVAWYRSGPERRFAPLAAGLIRLIAAAEEFGVRRFVHMSVPDAPQRLETELSYLVYKRKVDRALEASRLSYAIVRPMMLFAPRDVLLTVMLRTMWRYRAFPMFGDGEYHVSPISAPDVARILREEAGRADRRTVTVGGPKRWRYQELTDWMFRTLGRKPRYVRFTPRGSVRLARFIETFGSSLLYAYEVEWLLSDMLGLAPYENRPDSLEPVETFLECEARRLRRA